MRLFEMNYFQAEQAMGYRESIDVIPRLKFPPEWEIQIVPPFGGAMVRFRVFFGGKSASIYLDFHDNLGCMGFPYWEVYPVEDDIERCRMEETDRLMELIRQSLGIETDGHREP